MMLTFILFFALLIITTNAACPNGTIPTFSDPLLCYSFQSHRSVYLDAEEACQKLGGHLTSVHSMFDNVYLQDQALTQFPISNDFWFGANTHITTGNWIWMDQTTFDFSDWDNNQPQSTFGTFCGAMIIQGGYWISDDCFKLKPFVCEIFAT